MHILYLHQYFTTRSQVGGTRSYEFARYLQRQGHSVTIVTAAWDQLAKRSKTRRPELEGIDVIELMQVMRILCWEHGWGMPGEFTVLSYLLWLPQEQDYPCAGQTSCLLPQRH